MGLFNLSLTANLKKAQKNIYSIIMKRAIIRSKISDIRGKIESYFSKHNELLPKKRSKGDDKNELDIFIKERNDEYKNFINDKIGLTHSNKKCYDRPFYNYEEVVDYLYGIAEGKYSKKFYDNMGRKPKRLIAKLQKLTNICDAIDDIMWLLLSNYNFDDSSLKK